MARTSLGADPGVVLSHADSGVLQKSLILCIAQRGQVCVFEPARQEQPDRFSLDGLHKRARWGVGLCGIIRRDALSWCHFKCREAPAELVPSLPLDVDSTVCTVMPS
jgi:hypothetical protein